jgi:hypothetical protein
MMFFDADFMTWNAFAHRFDDLAATQQNGANARGTGLIAQDW